MRLLSFSMVLLTAACAGNAGDASGGADTPGGNVSFGGAQDIGQFRAAIERGEIPEQGSLDANGFFNEHYAATPDLAACTGALCLTPGISIGRDWLTGAHQATLQIAVSTPIDPATLPRLPMNLVVVVDHSGSMAEDDRLVKVRQGLNTLVENLENTDRIAIISFDDTVTIDSPFTDVIDRGKLHTAIDQLKPRGGTNIYDGLDAGFKLLGEYPTNERQNRVIFLSDGLATVGTTDRSSIMELARGWISHGIGLTTIGVGKSFDVGLMRGLAENGAGNYYFLEDAAAADEVFTEELDFFMTPIALDVSLAATSGTGWTFDATVGSNLWVAGRTKGTMSIPAAFVSSRTSQTPTDGGRRGGGSMIFIHLEATGDASTKIADLELTYRLPGSTESITQTLSLDYAANPTETPADPYLSGNEMAERYAMYNMFLGFRLAINSHDDSCALAMLAATKANASAWNERHPDPDLAADLELMDGLSANYIARGARVGTELASCPGADDPYGNPNYDGDDWEGYDDSYAQPAYCSTGKFNTSWLVILGVVGFAVRRRRR